MASVLESVWRERALWGSGRGKPRTLEEVEVRMRREATGVSGLAVDPPRRSTGPRCAPCSVEPLATSPPSPLCACFSCALAGAFSWEMCAGRSCREFPLCPLGSCKHPATREQSYIRRLSTQSRPGRSRSITRRVDLKPGYIGRLKGGARSVPLLGLNLSN